MFHLRKSKMSQFWYNTIVLRNSCTDVWNMAIKCAVIGQKAMSYQSIKHRKSGFYCFARPKSNGGPVFSLSSANKCKLGTLACGSRFLHFPLVLKCPSCFITMQCTALYLLNKTARKIWSCTLKEWQWGEVFFFFWFSADVIDRIIIIIALLVLHLHLFTLNKLKTGTRPTLFSGALINGY